MEEISRKNEKYLGLKGKLQNKELRGESPIRKNYNINNSFTQQKSNTVNSFKPGSGNSGTRIKSQQKQFSRMNSTNFNEGNNQSCKIIERPYSFFKGTNNNHRQVNI